MFDKELRSQNESLNYKVSSLTKENENLKDILKDKDEYCKKIDAALKKETRDFFKKGCDNNDIDLKLDSYSLIINRKEYIKAQLRENCPEGFTLDNLIDTFNSPLDEQKETEQKVTNLKKNYQTVEHDYCSILSLKDDLSESIKKKKEELEELNCLIDEKDKEYKVIEKGIIEMNSEKAEKEASKEAKSEASCKNFMNMLALDISCALFKINTVQDVIENTEEADTDNCIVLKSSNNAVIKETPLEESAIDKNKNETVDNPNLLNEIKPKEHDFIKNLMAEMNESLKDYLVSRGKEVPEGDVAKYEIADNNDVYDCKIYSSRYNEFRYVLLISEDITESELTDKLENLYKITHNIHVLCKDKELWKKYSSTFYEWCKKKDSLVYSIITPGHIKNPQLWQAVTASTATA